MWSAVRPEERRAAELPLSKGDQFMTSVANTSSPPRPLTRILGVRYEALEARHKLAQTVRSGKLQRKNERRRCGTSASCFVFRVSYFVFRISCFALRLFGVTFVFRLFGMTCFALTATRRPALRRPLQISLRIKIPPSDSPTTTALQPPRSRQDRPLRWSPPALRIPTHEPAWAAHPTPAIFRALAETRRAFPRARRESPALRSSAAPG